MESPPDVVEPSTMWLYLRVTQLCAYLRCFPPSDFPPEHISDLTGIIAQLERRVEMSQSKVYEYICHNITVGDQQHLGFTPPNWDSDSDSDVTPQTASSFELLDAAWSQSTS